MSATVRLAQPDDLRAVQDLNHELFLSDARHFADLNTSWPYAPEGEKYFRQRIEGEQGVCFVAEQEGTIVGYVAGGWNDLPAEAYKGKRAELENICVAEAARDHGIGAQLVQALYEWAKSNGADYIMVNAYTSNTGALHFYREHGFEDYSTTLWHKL